MYNLASQHVQQFLNVTPAPERYQIGVALAEADEVLRSQLRIDAGEGLVVTKVLPDTPASEAELRKHDILVELDGQRICNVNELNEQVQKIKDRKVNLALLRGGEEIRVELSPQLKNDSNLLNLTYEYVHPVRPGGVDNGASPVPLGLRLTTPVPQATLYAYNFLRDQQDDASQVDVAGQIAQLRRQFAEMQQSLKQLEETLQAQQESPAEESAGEDQPADKQVDAE
jgi:hypothetical protein